MLVEPTDTQYRGYCFQRHPTRFRSILQAICGAELIPYDRVFLSWVEMASIKSVPGLVPVGFGPSLSCSDLVIVKLVRLVRFPANFNVHFQGGMGKASDIRLLHDFSVWSAETFLLEYLH